MLGFYFLHFDSTCTLQDLLYVNGIAKNLFCNTTGKRFCMSSQRHVQLKHFVDMSIMENIITTEKKKKNEHPSITLMFETYYSVHIHYLFWHLC